MSEYDSPWKEALERFLPLFLAFFFPDIHADIDWSADYEAQDTELHKLAPEGELGKRLADKLVKVRRQSGDETLVHVELQVQNDPELPQRTYVYQYRATDRYNLPVVSLVILGDDNPPWRPDVYEFALWGCSTTFRFRTAKLLDWAERLEELEGHENPLAMLVWAHLQAQRTHGDPVERQRCKLRALRRLYEHNLDQTDVRHWYRYFDWLLNLPFDLEDAVWAEMNSEKEASKVPFITFAERYGRRDELLRALDAILPLRFGGDGTALMPLLRKQHDFEVLRTIFDAALTATSADSLRQMLSATDEKEPPVAN